VKFRRGLVIGKFAPLHRGHEHLIAHARDACEALIVLGYTNPELPRCERRQEWLERAFPGTTCVAITADWLQARAPHLRVPPNDASPEAQRAFVARVCLDALGTSVDAVFTSEPYGDGFAAALSRHFAAPVAHVAVDPERRAVPISASRIRADPHGLRAFLSPHVYASYVDRIALIGGESSGKSTLAAALAEHFGTRVAPEYGRELWLRKKGLLEREDYLHIAEQQIARERAEAEQAHRYVFCDTTPATTLFYARDAFGSADARLEVLARRRYELQVLCAPDFPFVQDGTRRDSTFRRAQHDFYLAWLERSEDPWMVAQGRIEARVHTVATEITHLTGGAPND